MERILASPWFLASTAVCCGLATAFTTWLAADSSSGVRLLAALMGLAAGLIVMLLVAWAAADEGEASLAAAPAAAPPERPLEPVQPVAGLDDARAALRLRLEEGRALHEELEPAATDPRVGSWIEAVRQTVAQSRPGLVGYLDQLTHRPYADDRGRLDAHLRRLGTIVRETS